MKMNGAPVQAKLRYSLGEQVVPLSVSGGIEALLGFRADEFLTGQVHFIDRIHADDADIARLLFNCPGKERSGWFNVRLRHADGRIRCVCGTYMKEPGESAGETVLDLLLADAGSLYGIEKQPAGICSIGPTMNLVNEALYFKNRNHVFTAASRATVLAFSGTLPTSSHLLGKTDYDLFPEKYADAYYALEKKALSGIAAVSDIQPVPLKNGQEKWVDNIKYAVKSPAGEVIGLFGIARDVSQRVQGLEKLRESEESLRESQAIAGLGTYCVDVGAARWTSSDVLDELLGIGKDYDRSVEGWARLVHPGDRAGMVNYFRDEVLSQHKPFDREYRVIRPSDGVVRWMHGLGRLEFDAQGRPKKMLGTIRDITERKVADAALRESRELLQLFIEHAPVAIAMLDRAMRYLAVSRRWLDMHELQGEDLIGRSHYEIFPNLPESWLELHRRALAGETVQPGEDKLCREGGSFRWVRREIRPWFSGDGSIGGIMIFSEDVTERKRAEITSKQTMDLLQLFVEHAPVAIAMFDREMRYLAVSRRWARDHGLEIQEIIGHSHYEINPEVPERWKETHRRGLAGERQRVEEDRYDRADGAVQWIRWEIIPWLAGDGSAGGIIMFYEDITERRRTHAALRESKELLELFIAHAPAAMAMFDRGMRYLAASKRWCEEYSLNLREIIGRCHYDIFPELPQRWKDAHRRGMEGEPLFCEEDPYEMANGTVQWVKWEVVPWRAGDGSIGGIILFAEDITAYRATEERLRLAASVFTNAREGITITDPEGTILEVNEMFTRITGYTRQEAIGRNPRMLRSGVHSSEFYANMWRSLLHDGQWTGEIWNRNKGGELYAETLTINAVRDAQGNLQQYVALFSDITQLKKHAQQLEHMTHYDVLTSLPNRALLVDRLHQAMAQANRRKQFVAVAYLDLDGFKSVNDQHGRDAGDRLLTSLAFDMKCALREGDTLARLGGDEFVAVILDLDDAAASLPILEQLRDAAAEPVQVGDLSLSVSASLGVTFYPQPEESDPDLLLRQADQAMYQAKLAGGSRYHIYDPDHDLTVRGRHENLEHIRHALAQCEFLLYYQPKVNMRTGEVVGVEALIRWQHPDRGLLPPGMFLPIIEDHPLAIDMGEWVIDTALSQMETWHAAGLEIPVSVNVSAMQLQQPDFVDRLSELLSAHPAVKPFNLEIEVLETSDLRDVVQTSEVLNACQKIGVSFALDDFGTGYSSLTYLKRLPADVLKIDQSFVSDMLEDPENLNILEGILSLASAFHRKVIAEGVETVEHGLMLLQLGCELAQGYGIARPMPADEVRSWASNWRPDPLWARVPPVHSGNKSLLYACVEHRAWIAALEGFLMGKRHAPPAMDPRQCRFGKWLESERLAGRGNESGCHSIDATHRQLHELAAEVLLSQVQGRHLDGLGRLNELHGICDQFLEKLDTFRRIS